MPRFSQPLLLFVVFATTLSLIILFSWAPTRKQWLSPPQDLVDRISTLESQLDRLQALEDKLHAVESVQRWNNPGWDSCLHFEFNASCEFQQPGAAADALPCQGDVLWELLTVVDDVLRGEPDVKHWLGFGTLLGAVRHRGFIPWTGDVDLMFVNETSRALARRILPKLQERGFFTFLHTNALMRVCVAPHHPHLRRFTKPWVEREKEKLLYTDTYPYLDMYHGGFAEWNGTLRVQMPLGCDFDAKYVLPTTTMAMYGRAVPVPADPVEYLRMTYGPDFMTPPAQKSRGGSYSDTCLRRFRQR